MDEIDAQPDLCHPARMHHESSPAASTTIGETGVRLPPVIFGTSCLGNLYAVVPDEDKLAITRECVQAVPAPVALDTAGKYGAGLALEVIARNLRALEVGPDQVTLSNKLGWKRVPMRGPEPTFEKGVWFGLDHDAEQCISYQGILDCYKQADQLLGGAARQDMVSVHDPDEYLAAATGPEDEARRRQDILQAYQALFDLRRDGRARAVGVGAKDWKVLRWVAEETPLDWVMLACSFTILHHPPELLRFIDSLHRRGVTIINSAVFHAGFLTGGKFFDYRIPSPDDPAEAPLFAWREKFLALCARHAVDPAAACVRFGMSAPGVVAVSLNTGNPARVAGNAALASAVVPEVFWRDLKEAGLIARDYPFVG